MIALVLQSGPKKDFAIAKVRESAAGGQMPRLSKELEHGLLNSNTWTGNAAKTASASEQDEACITRRDCCLG